MYYDFSKIKVSRSVCGIIDELVNVIINEVQEFDPVPVEDISKSEKRIKAVMECLKYIIEQEILEESGCCIAFNDDMTKFRKYIIKN